MKYLKGATRLEELWITVFVSKSLLAMLSFDIDEISYFCPPTL
jgi:hypothetical protein